MKHRVSVVIPTFNRAALVADAVSSVLEQSVQPHEIIVVDDCSTDDTPEVLQQFRSQIQVLRTSRNGERGAARNLGARESTGEILAFLDSDDRWNPDKLARQAPLAALGPCVTGYELIDRNGTVSGARVPSPQQQGLVMLENCFFGSASSLMLPRDVFELVGGYETDRALQGSEDWILLACLHRSGHLVRVLSDLAVQYRVHRGASTRDVANLERSMWSACAWLERNLPSSQAIDGARRARTASALARAFAASGAWLQALKWAGAAYRYAGWSGLFQAATGIARAPSAPELGALPQARRLDGAEA